MSSTFQRVLIVNRGEPAMRLIHAVREFSQEHRADLQTIALYTDADRRAMFVREADEAVYLGPATFVDERDGGRKVGYLDYGRLESALRDSRAEAAWVGWGFVAEHANGYLPFSVDLSQDEVPELPRGGKEQTMSASVQSEEITGAILDASLRVGYDFTDRVAGFFNLRYLGGGAVGTESNPNPPSDGYTKNWLHFITVSLGVEFQAVRR